MKDGTRVLKVIIGIKTYYKTIRTSIHNTLRALHNHPYYQTLQAKLGKRTLNYLISTSLIIFLYLLLTLHHPKKLHEKPPVPVLLAKVRRDDVPLYLNTIGTVTPLDSSTIKTQINGYLTRVLFQEGQWVQKGDLLAQIDPSPYEAQLKQAEGQLVRDKALLDNARLDLRRYQKLYTTDSISQQTLDTQTYLVKQYEGTVKADQGVVDAAKTNLHYCRIIANISGIIGLRQINPGNFVQTSDTTPLTTINTLQPITVVFPIPEDDLPRVLKNSKKEPLITEAFDRKEETRIETGHLNAIDSQIDPTTGTIKLKAIFPNKKEELYPNQFVNIRLKLNTLQNVLVVPTAAIQMGREGPFLYVVNHNKTVSLKKIEVTTTFKEDSVVSGDGIFENQEVVIQGYDKLAEGVKVSLSKDVGSRKFIS